MINEKIASTLQKTHDAIDHFSSNIVLNKIKKKVFWFHMTNDVKNYILKCLSCAQWIIAIKQMFFSFIQIYKFYDLFDIDFMNWSKFISKKNFKHVCNMIDYFSKSLYSYSIYDTSIMNVKKFFSHYHECDHSMFVTIYWNVDSTFIFFEMKNIFRTLNIIVIQIFNQLHKFVDMIERTNKTLRVSMRKMIKSKNTQKTILKKNIHAINDRHIEHFDYSLNEIVYDIEFRNINVVNFVKTLKYSKKIVLSFEKKMMFLIWNHMIKKKIIQQKIIDRIIKTKQRMKKKYDRNVQLKIFVIN